MKKTDLSGLTQKTFDITQNVQTLSFQNVSPNASIKIVVDKENRDIFTPVPTMNLGKLLEGQDKLKSLISQRTIVRHLKNVAADAANRIDVLVSDDLVLCPDGEYPIGENDKITVYLTDLGKVAESSVTEFVGAKEGTRLLGYGKVVFLKSHDEKKLDLTGVSAVLVDPSNIPSSIELYYETETMVLDADVLKQLNIHDYGMIRMATNEAGVSSPVFGFAESLLISMKGVRKCVLKDEGSASDITVYTIK
jgi:hypothetical protein